MAGPDDAGRKHRATCAILRASIAMEDLAKNAAALLLRELAALRREVDAYPDDASIWAQPEALPNPAGSLVLHLCGNLRHFIGTRLGQSDYVRDRQREFSARELSRAELLREIDEAESVVRNVLPHLSDEQLEGVFPETLAGHSFSTADFIMHLCSHFAYHLGQVDYHRRIVTGNSAGVGALPLNGLRTATRVGS